MTSVQGKTCVVTGGSGFVGRRVVELLVKGGAAKVVSYDIRKADLSPAMNFLTQEEMKRVEYYVGDITDAQDVERAFKDADIVWHIAALVGPFFPQETYYAVNVKGTQHVIDACRKHGITKLIASSSPSTRFDGNDIVGKKEEELQIRPKGEFLQAYAETKAEGEMLVRQANSDGLYTVVIAPHQVYGPRDGLFLPNFLAVQETGRLRVFGNGKNMVSFTHVDNYSHALINAADKLHEGSPVLGKFYIVTDGPPQNLWESLDKAGMALGMPSLFDRFKLPTAFMLGLAYFLMGITALTGVRFRIIPFNVKMLTIHRWFDITNAERDLDYKPAIKFDDGWAETCQWMKENKEWWRVAAGGLLRKK